MRSMKKRITNMNIHHKNMKQVSRDMQSWIQSSLSSFGIFECGYHNINIKDKTLLPIPTMYNWYCEYLERGLDLHTPTRIKNADKYWNSQDSLFQAYDKHVPEDERNTLHKIDLVSKFDHGYELFSVGSYKPLSRESHIAIHKCFKEVSYQANKIKKKKPNILLDLRAIDEFKSLHETNQLLTNTEYKKSNFNGVILTPKELQYIEYLVFNLNHKEIAYRHQCSQTAVRKVLCNIKRKMGNSYMPTSHLLLKMNEIGVLRLISKSFM